VSDARTARDALPDYHIHTARCGHAVGRMEEYVAQARKVGLTEIGFSDHLYTYWLPEHDRDPELAMAEHELDDYVEDVLRLRRANADLTIRLAIEADFIPGHEAELKRILSRYPWDYVLGSVHFVDGWGLDDSRYIDRYDEWDIDELYESYFGLVAAAAETGYFDSMSHPDLVKKFGYRPAPDYDLGTVFERVAEAFKRTGVCVEVNTAGLSRPCAEIYPSLDLLRACQRRGVPATIGSDAHEPGRVGDQLAVAVSHLRAAGYDGVIRFAGRRRERIWLP
jgi:histidinol-phosphatase (PHP family)